MGDLAIVTTLADIKEGLRVSSKMSRYMAGDPRFEGGVPDVTGLMFAMAQVMGEHEAGRLKEPMSIMYWGKEGDTSFFTEDNMEKWFEAEQFEEFEKYMTIYPTGRIVIHERTHGQPSPGCES